MVINWQQGTTCLLSQLLFKVTVTSCRSSAGILHGCLRQDGAPSHTARNTPSYLWRENVTFIERHIWPPKSPDLNLVDCAVWGALQQNGLSTSLPRTPSRLGRGYPLPIPHPKLYTHNSIRKYFVGNLATAAPPQYPSAIRLCTIDLSFADIFFVFTVFSL